MLMQSYNDLYGKNANPAIDQNPETNLSAFIIDLSVLRLVVDVHLILANRLLSGRERIDRVLTEDQWDTRAQYMAALPQLCEEVKHLDIIAVQQCQEMLRSPKPNRFYSELRRIGAKIHQLLERFHFQDQVLDATPPSIKEVRRQLGLSFYFGSLARAGVCVQQDTK